MFCLYLHLSKGTKIAFKVYTILLIYMTFPTQKNNISGVSMTV